MLLVLVSSFRNSESYQQISVKTTYQTTRFQIRYLLCLLNIQIQFDWIMSRTLQKLFNFSGNGNTIFRRLFHGFISPLQIFKNLKEH